MRTLSLASSGLRGHLVPLRTSRGRWATFLASSMRWLKVPKRQSSITMASLTPEVSRLSAYKHHDRIETRNMEGDQGDRLLFLRPHDDGTSRVLPATCSSIITGHCCCKDNEILVLR